MKKLLLNKWFWVAVFILIVIVKKAIIVLATGGSVQPTEGDEEDGEDTPFGF